MGILSRLGFMQQGAFLPQQQEVFSPYFGAQPQQPAPAPQPRQSPAMTGFQSPANLPTAQPMQANQSPLAQLNTAPAPSPQFSFMDRLAMGANQLPNNALFNMGLSLLGNAQGSRWDRVAGDMQAFGQQQQQRQILQNEQRRQAAQDRREETTFGRQQSEWQRADQRRERLGSWAGQQQGNPLAAVDPELAFQAEAEAMAIANQPLTPFQQEQLNLERARINESRAARQAQDAWSRRFQSALGAADAGAVAEQGALVRQGVTTVRPILQEMRSIIQQYPDIMGSWLNTGDRMQMVRLAGGDQQRLAAMERLNALATQLTLPQLEALRPATNLDFERIRSTIADPQMSLQGALGFLDSQEQSLNRALQVSESQGQWINQYGSLSMPNDQGQTWASANANAPFMQFQAPPQQQAAPPPPGGPPEAARRAGFTYWNGTMWTRPPEGQRRNSPPSRNAGDRNNPYGAY